MEYELEVIEMTTKDMQDEDKTKEDEYSISQRVTQVISLAGIGLMVAGFGLRLMMHVSSSMPGKATLPIPDLIKLNQEPISLIAMSLGIFILLLVPSLRVLLAEWRFIRHREVINILAALLVLLELVFSIRLGIHI
jgi:uncharacterized membrane protein